MKYRFEKCNATPAQQTGRREWFSRLDSWPCAIHASVAAIEARTRTNAAGSGSEPSAKKNAPTGLYARLTRCVLFSHTLLALVGLGAFLAATFGLIRVAYGESGLGTTLQTAIVQPARLAKVGAAFYLPVALPRDDRQPLAGLDAAVTVTPAGILRPEYASGPRRCLSALGARGVAIVCEPPRRITGAPVAIVYTAIGRGQALVTFGDCRLGETVVACPPPITVEVR